MSNLFTFHKTVLGYLHIKKNLPCEDASASYSDPEGRYHIAVVADGHGSSACPKPMLLRLDDMQEFY